MRNTNLDIMRVIAAIMVLSVHVGQYFTVITSCTKIGAKGVQLFFILSGYLVMYSVERSESVVSFYRKRMIHIIPVYYIVLIGMYVCDIIQYFFLEHCTLKQIFGINGVCGIRYLRYFSFLQMFIPSDQWYLWNNRNALWTLSAFVMFYILAPLIYICCKSFRKAFFVLTFLLIVNIPMKRIIADILSSFCFVSEPILFAEMNPVSVLYNFFFGVTLFYAEKEGKENKYAVLILGTALIFQMNWFVYECFFTLALVIMIKGDSILNSNESNKVLRILSQSSFALYLCHFKILQVVDNIWKYLRIESLQILKLIRC